MGKGSDRLIPEFVEDGEAGERASGLHGELYAKRKTADIPCPAPGSY
jgi:hypothetical protein